MDQKDLEIPIILNGQAFWPKQREDHYSLAYESGVTVVIPKLTEADLRALGEADKYLLHHLHFQEIISFFRRVGEFWSLQNRDQPLYRQAIDSLCSINGYSRKMAQREINILSSTLRLHTSWHDLLDAELGNRFYLEEWIPKGDALVHAQPLGNVLHILVGNVPASGMMSIVRGAITKNRTIAKLPKRDPITTTYMVLSCLEIDAEHPVSRSMNILYWPGGDAIVEPILKLADVVCVWGRSDVVEGIKSKTRLGVDVLEFGPKTSFTVIGREAADSKKVALGLAHDVSIYNQEACFSPQIAFVEGDPSALVKNLAESMELYVGLMPKGQVTSDVHAHVSRSRLEAYYNKNEVVCSIGATEWTITVISDMSEINEHPLSRVIYILPVEQLRDCVQFVNNSSQTIAIAPWHRNIEIRDEVTLRGATKITEVGLVEAFRIGSSHDGIYPLQRLVRWVCVERGCDYWGKYIQQGPVDTTLWLMMDERQLEQIVFEDGDASAIHSRQ
jgi:long-chain-fatty-acyl-CoA reductase